MLNTYDHEDADALAQSARDKLPGIVRLRERAEAAPDTRVACVSDICGAGALSRPDLFDRPPAGRPPDVAEPTAPREPVPFIPKGRHSIFYETALDHLLRENDVNHIVLSG